MTDTLTPVAPAPTEVAEPPPRAGARPAAWLAVAAVLLALLTLPGGDLVGGGGFASLADGPLEVASGDDWRALEVGDDVPAGRQLRVTTGQVTLAFPDGGSVALTPGARARWQEDEGLVLTRGSIVVRDTDVTVTVGASRARGTGTWRVDAGERARVATYDAEVVASDGAARRELPRYAQVGLRDGALEGTVLPLRYLPADPFDAVEVAEAIRIDELAAALGRSLTGTYGDSPREPEFYASFVAVDDRTASRLEDVAPIVEGDRLGPPADVLLAAVAIDALVVEGELPRRRAVAEVASLRSDGAAWGVVLLRHDRTAADLRAAADRALEQAAETPPPPDPAVTEDAAGEAADVTGATEPTAPPGPAAPPPGGPAAPTRPSPAPGGGGGNGGGGDGPPPPSRGPLAPVEDLVRGTGDLLSGVVEGTTGTVGDVVGTVDDLLTPSSGRGLLNLG